MKLLMLKVRYKMKSVLFFFVLHLFSLTSITYTHHEDLSLLNKFYLFSVLCVVFIVFLFLQNSPKIVKNFCFFNIHYTKFYGNLIFSKTFPRKDA